MEIGNNWNVLRIGALVSIEPRSGSTDLTSGEETQLGVTYIADNLLSHSIVVLFGNGSTFYSGSYPRMSGGQMDIEFKHSGSLSVYNLSGQFTNGYGIPVLTGSIGRRGFLGLTVDKHNDPGIYSASITFGTASVDYNLNDLHEWLLTGAVSGNGRNILTSTYQTFNATETSGALNTILAYQHNFNSTVGWTTQWYSIGALKIS